jgi:hypothetical protein
MRRAVLIGIVVAGVAALNRPVWGGIHVVDLGTGGPPASLGGFALNAFPPDPTPKGQLVREVCLDDDCCLAFDRDMQVRIIGSSWETWSHGYTGKVYWTMDFVTEVTMHLPGRTQAFAFYAQPNPYFAYEFTAQTSDGTFLTFPIHGRAGARGWGFYTTGDSVLEWIRVSSTIDFAVGEFLIHTTCTPSRTVPEPAGLAVWSGLAAAFLFRRRSSMFLASPGRPGPFSGRARTMQATAELPSMER